MSKNASDLPSQGAALRAAIERQQRELRNMNRVLVTSSIARDFERMRSIAGAGSIARDLARMQRTVVANSFLPDLERVQRTIGANLIARDLVRMQRIATVRSIFRDIGRIRLTLSVTNIAKDYRRIAEALKAQQQRALRVQRLLSRSPIIEALEHIKRTTELYQRQCKYIARATIGGGFAKDIQGIAESAGNAPASRRSDKRKASTSIRKDAEATPGTSNAIGFVSKKATVEWKITVFLAKLPAYFELPENPLPKHRMH